MSMLLNTILFFTTNMLSDFEHFNISQIKLILIETIAEQMCMNPDISLQPKSINRYWTQNKINHITDF